MLERLLVIPRSINICITYLNNCFTTRFWIRNIYYSSAKHDKLHVQGSTVAWRRLTVNKVIKYLQSRSFQSNEFCLEKNIKHIRKRRRQSSHILEIGHHLHFKQNIKRWEANEFNFWFHMMNILIIFYIKRRCISKTTQSCL